MPSQPSFCGMFRDTIRPTRRVAIQAGGFALLSGTLCGVAAAGDRPRRILLGRVGRRSTSATSPTRRGCWPRLSGNCPKWRSRSGRAVSRVVSRRCSAAGFPGSGSRPTGRLSIQPSPTVICCSTAPGRRSLPKKTSPAGAMRPASRLASTALRCRERHRPPRRPRPRRRWPARSLCSATRGSSFFATRPRSRWPATWAAGAP